VNTVVIAGVGLIGGSFALAIRRAGLSERIIGVSSPETLKKALALGVVDEGMTLAEAAGQADLVYLAQPIQQILETLGTLDSRLQAGALVTDAGSTKAMICGRAADTMQRARFVGGHPMAGKESRGVEEAEASLFEGRPYVLTSREPLLEQWVEAIGARVVFLDPQEHDQLVALVSHLPQLLSTALAGAIGDQPGAARVAGPSASDLTRLALSPYEIWRDILATNSVSIDAALKTYIAKLESLRVQLKSPEMERVFEKAATSARELRKS
jgi:prephenate dehydrogenase